MTIEYGLKALIACPVKALTGPFDQTINIVVKDLTLDNFKILPSKVKVQKQHTNITVLEVPRYGDFQATINALAQSTSKIIEIGGQRIIQVKVRSTDALNEIEPAAQIKAWANTHNIQFGYTWRVPSVAYTYASLTVPVEKLQTLIREANTHNFEVVYIHDF